MSNIAENIKNAAEILQTSGVAESRREAASLLAFALQKDKTFLAAHPEYNLLAAEQQRFQQLLRRRARREPFQYITGRQEFYGLDFLITPDVLIPRPETELIVENAIEILHGKSASEFCEIGVGSGCIFVSILHELKTTCAVGLDVSEKALQIAGQNARRHEVADRIELKISDVFEALKYDGKIPPGLRTKRWRYDSKFDLIVSNPPYVSGEDVENLQREVRDYEPIAALTDGKNGLTIIEKIIRDAPNFLKPNSFLLLEIGFNQAGKVREMFSPQIWQKVEILPDLQNIPRTVRAKIDG